MAFWDENKSTVNIVLLIVGAIIILYYLIPNMVNSRVLSIQVDELRAEVRDLRKMIFKLTGRGLPK